MRLLLLALLLASPAAAMAPVPRPDAAALALRPGPEDMRPTPRLWRPHGEVALSRRPADRPAMTRRQRAILADPAPWVGVDGLVRVSSFPRFRPLDRFRERLRAADAAVPDSVPGGGLCGVPTLVGEPIGRIDGAGACGVEEAVRVRSVAGVALSTPARVECDTARALDRWVRGSAIPAFGAQGDRLVSMRNVSSYSCRRIRGSGRVSEHGKGRAIDIAAFRLASGRSVSLIQGWGGEYGRVLRDVWRGACGPFATVLGPNADAAHRDHFHLDTARRRSGRSYCR